MLPAQEHSGMLSSRTRQLFSPKRETGRLFMLEEKTTAAGREKSIKTRIFCLLLKSKTWKSVEEFLTARGNTLELQRPRGRDPGPRRRGAGRTGTYLSRDEKRRGQASNRKTTSVFTAQPQKRDKRRERSPQEQREGEKGER